MNARRLTTWLLVGGAAAWVVSAVIVWAVAPPLGHDEAQYAIAATDLLAGHEPRWFYVSRGMSIVALPGVLAGGSELALRFLPLLLGCGFLAASWWLARTVCGAETAAWVVLVLAASRFHVALSGALLSDLPSAAFLIAATAVIAGERGRETLRWRVVWLAPLFAAAYYVRYASCVPILAISVGWLALGGRAIVRRPGPVVAALAVFLVLWTPHLVEAYRLTGSPFGIALESGSVISDLRTSSSPLPYFTTNPIESYGAILVPLLVAGLLAWGSRSARRERSMWFVWGAALSSIVVMGWVGLMQPRYITFGVTLLVILGVDVIRRAVADRPLVVRRTVAAIAAGTLAAVALGLVVTRTRRGDNRSRALAAELTAARVIRTDIARTGAASCVVSANSYTQLEWYSGCAADAFAGYDPLERGVPLYAVMKPAEPPRPPSAREQATTIAFIPGVVTIARITRAR